MNNIKRFISELKQQVDKELICIADPPIGIQDDPSAYGGKNGSIIFLALSFFLWDEPSHVHQWRLMSISFKKKYSSSG